MKIGILTVSFGEERFIGALDLSRFPDSEKVTGSDLYNFFEEWCRVEDKELLSKRDFGQKAKELVEFRKIKGYGFYDLNKKKWLPYTPLGQNLASKKNGGVGSSHFWQSFSAPISRGATLPQNPTPPYTPVLSSGNFKDDSIPDSNSWKDSSFSQQKREEEIPDDGLPF